MRKLPHLQYGVENPRNHVLSLYSETMEEDEARTIILDKKLSELGHGVQRIREQLDLFDQVHAKNLAIAYKFSNAQFGLMDAAMFGGTAV